MSELLERCIDEEQSLRFTSFSHRDALYVGNEIIRLMEERHQAVAIEIFINGLKVFCYYPDGTGKFHEKWLGWKRNTVETLEKSSLHVFAELEEKNTDMLSENNLSVSQYAVCGGGFPIFLKNGCMVGTICVSGLPHLQDHDILVTAIHNYLNATSKTGD